MTENSGALLDHKPVNANMIITPNPVLSKKEYFIKTYYIIVIQHSEFHLLRDVVANQKAILTL